MSVSSRFSRIGRRLRRLLIFAVVLVAFVLGWRNVDLLVGWMALKPDAVIVEIAPDPAYEALIPRYVEVCATSQWRKRIAGAGNPFGHAVMYLKGACMDADAPYPQLRRCAHAASDVADPEHGAGVSVGRWFRNVNWVGTPGHDLFYNGGLAPGERLTQERYDATVQAAVEAGVFRGVEVHDGWTSGEDRSLTRFVADESIGTDFALRYARNLFCARMPVTEEQIDEMIAFLNDKNHEYATGAYDYNWNLLADNCVHTLRNAMSAAHFLPAMSVAEIMVRHLFNPATPANEFVNVAVLGGEGPLADPAAIAAETPLESALFDFRWLPTRHGALVKTMPIHAENDLFDTAFQLFAVQSPLRLGATRAALRLMSDPAHVDFEANLARSIAVYDRAIGARERAALGLETVRGDPLRRLSRAHLSYLREQRAEAATMLADLRAYRAGEEAGREEAPDAGSRD